MMKLNMLNISLNLTGIMIFMVACGQSGSTTNKSFDVSPFVQKNQYEVSATSTPYMLIPNPTFTPTNEHESTPKANLESRNIDNTPTLQNLLVKNLGPYDASEDIFGDLKYDTRFNGRVFNEFGFPRIDGQGHTRYNPTFEFKAPADTLLIAPVTGQISYIEWQPSQNDWEIHIKTSNETDWRLGIDHLLSLDCNRTDIPVPICNLPLKINGDIIVEGMSVEAGDLIGYIGTWSDHDDIGINGRTELTVFKYLNGYDGVINYCPIAFLSTEVREIYKSTISELMQSFEKWTGDQSTFNEQKMVAPGCLYEAIKEFDGKIELIID